MKSYIELGYGYINELKLFYSYNSDNYIPSLDAKTLKNTYSPVSSQNSLSYTDITNHWAKKQITSLATYGIGFKGESFKPNGKLTQKDFLTLLVKALGDNYLDETVKENESIIYSSAYANGILTPSEKNPSKVLTRVETIKYLLNATSYKFAAKYPELFTLSFKDANKIPAADKGYVALASALKIITGDQNNKINPLDTATRAQGAVMIYNFMNRK